MDGCWAGGGGHASLIRPNSTSVGSVRSCASSRMITRYRTSSGSLMASRRSTPSVMNLGRNTPADLMRVNSCV